MKIWNNDSTKYCEGWNFGPRTESIATVWDVAEKVVENYFSEQRAKNKEQRQDKDTVNSQLFT